MQKLFGTDGVRGVVDDKTSQLCFKIGKTLGIYLNKNKQNKIVIAKDTRQTCDMMLSALSCGLMCQGVNVVYAGVMTTPALSFLTKTQKFNLGVMITASHNTPEYNGVKIFDSLGNKPNTKLEQHLQKIYAHINNYKNVDYKTYGKFTSKQKLKYKYINYLKQFLKDFYFEDKVCFDLSNGAANFIIKPLLNHFKNYVIIGDKTKGCLVNHNCGATNIQALQQAVINNNCKYGFAYDGDADRVIMVDKLGKVIDGDDILYILALYLKQNKLLHNNTVVGTIMANYGLQDALIKQNINFVRVKVGDKYIVDYINKHNLSLGGEQAGHIIIPSLTNTGDGVLVSLVLCKAISFYKDKFDDILKNITKYPQVIKNVKVNQERKQSILINQKLQECITLCESLLLDDGRIVVRASGTEPVIRVMTEGKDYELINKLADTIINTIQQLN